MSKSLVPHSSFLDRSESKGHSNCAAHEVEASERNIELVVLLRISQGTEVADIATNADIIAEKAG